MNRRNAIRLLGLATLSVAARPAQARPRERIIVVGAGMSGIATARTLANAGFSVVVLEARDRIGGRVHTSHAWPDAPVELGASWIHDSDGNPLTPLARRIGARLVMTDSESSVAYDALEGRLETGRRSVYAAVRAKVARAIRAGYEADADMSLSDAVEQSIGETASPLERRLVDHFVISLADDDFAGDSSELSAKYWDYAITYRGLDALLPDGYATLVDSLASGLDVRLGAHVVEVRTTETGVEVDTRGKTPDGGESATETVTADRVVVTIPLGALQNGGIRFSPELPEAKLEALVGLGMGTLTKLWMRFPRVFWDDVDWIEFVADSRAKGDIHQWLSAVRPSGGHPILLGFLGGYAAEAAELEPIADTTAKAMKTLRVMYPGAPDPIAVQRSEWSRDPLAYGTYSFNSTRGTPALRDALAAPVGERLFFAGEATHKRRFATVDGAWLSGLRAAKQVRRAAG